MKELRALATDHWRTLGVVVLLGAPAAVFEAGALLVTAAVAVRVSGDRSEDVGLLFGASMPTGVGSSLTLAACLVVLSAALRVAVGLVRSRAIAQYERSLRSSLAERYVNADYAAQGRVGEGEFLQLSSGAVIRAGGGLSAVTQGVLAVTSLFTLLTIAVVSEPAVGAALLLLAAVLVSLLRPLATGVRRATSLNARVSVEQAEVVSEAVSGAQDIALFSAQEPVLRTIEDGLTVEEQSRRRTLALTAVAPVAYQGLGLLMLIGAVAILAVQDEPRVGAVGGIVLLVFRSLGYGQQAQTRLVAAVESGAFLERIKSCMARLCPAPQGEDTLVVQWPAEIVFDNVTFEYADHSAGQRALQSLSLVLPYTGSVGLIGPSGAGKSTFAEVLLRLREPTSGTILVSGSPVGRVSVSGWRSAVALVPQRCQLLSGTVSDNIRYFRDALSHESVVRAARRAGIHKAIMDLPDGYDTRLGVTDRSLSGGQLQRLAIARALVARPSVIVMDEPTSALDADAESVVTDAVSLLAQSALVIVVAHRPATLRVCERLVVMDAGRVVDEGHRDDVLARNEFAKRLLLHGP